MYGVVDHWALVVMTICSHQVSSARRRIVKRTSTCEGERGAAEPVFEETYQTGTRGEFLLIHENEAIEQVPAIAG